MLLLHASQSAPNAPPSLTRVFPKAWVVHALMNRKSNKSLLTFLVMLTICDFYDIIFCSTAPRLTTSSKKGITSPPFQTPGKFKAFICLTAWLDPKIIALVL